MKAEDDPRSLDDRIGRLMRSGTAAASGLIVAGVVADAGGVEAVSRGLLVAGFVALILLPLGRVLLMAVSFRRDRDPAFVAISLFVLGLVVVTAIVGVAGA